MTEEKAKRWLFDSMISDVSKEDLISFLKCGHERGYIKKTALEQARELATHIETDCMIDGTATENLLRVCDLYEQAVKEAKVTHELAG